MDSVTALENKDYVKFLGVLIDKLLLGNNTVIIIILKSTKLLVQ